MTPRMVERPSSSDLELLCSKNTARLLSRAVVAADRRGVLPNCWAVFSAGDNFAGMVRIDAAACNVFLYGLLLLRATSGPQEWQKLRDTRPMPTVRIVANHLLSGMRFPAYRPAKSIPFGTSRMRSLRC
jgi:hypothetical protein